MEAGRCDFRGENQLDAGAVLKCFPPLSLSYYSQVNAEGETSKTPIYAILSRKDDKTQQMRQVYVYFGQYMNILPNISI